METDQQGTLRRGQLCGSQFLQPATDQDSKSMHQLVDPRVGRTTASRPGVLDTPGVSWTKLSGEGKQTTSAPHWTRKRALRRARNRAERHNGTMYRGQWHSPEALGVRSHNIVTGERRPATGVRTATHRIGARRLKFISYNVGGLDQTAYDVFKTWLGEQKQADVVVVQELHFGCGREDAQWCMDSGWRAYITADAGQRSAGVGIFLAPWLTKDASISACTWSPGRLLHVRCETARLTLDVIGFYQQVHHAKRGSAADSIRLQHWNKLSKLVHGLPKRNLLLIGMDANSVCDSCQGLVGRGVLRQPNRHADTEFMQLIREHELVLLNTWGRACRSHASTYMHGLVCTQIDFVITRRVTADQTSRATRPIMLDLVPWRLGPKHRPLAGSIPFVAGWAAKHNVKPSFSGLNVHALREAFRQGGPLVTECLKPRIEALLEATTDASPGSLTLINRNLMQICVGFFPKTRNSRKPAPKVGFELAQQQGIHRLWDLHRHLKCLREEARNQNSFVVWKAYEAVQQQYRSLKAQSRAIRRRRLELRIDEAHQAAARHDMSAVYRIIRTLAPKRRHINLTIRSQEGHLLSQRQQFEAIRDFFRAEYDRADDFVEPAPSAVLSLSVAEIQQAIGQLKNNKAVPGDSLPAEIWKLCQESFAVFLHRVLTQGVEEGHAYPREISDCSLALLPKPGKPGKQPGDLRPLGLQDPSSKIYATVLKHKITEQARDLLASRPQYAYSAGRSIDTAITRVARHCAQVRDHLQRSVVSVHDKRQGRRAMGCVGGAMIGLDLSRAFDKLPRWALQASLEHASVDSAVCRAVIAIHERCMYTIKHGPHEDRIAMKRGIRQGCSLSPSLYSIFTIWVFDQLSAITSPEWAQACITLFADDSHLAWLISSQQDLDFACHCIRRTVALFRSVGMDINPSKSTFVLQIKGSTAKRWIQVHQQQTAKGPVIDVGLPHAPLLVPRAKQMICLGVVASYQGFELQTCKHRMQIAMQNKHRLLKILHASNLTQKYRLRLYLACIRSTMLFGQHAVGLTPTVLYKLEQADARALRAISRSPSFLTKESTVALRKRLAVNSPREALCKLLQGRIDKCNDEHSASFFREQLSIATMPVEGACTASLQPCVEQEGVPCTVCGLYFVNRRIMLSHQARKHPETCQAKPVLTAAQYASQTVDGMPCCVHCGRKFTRVEGLKKHLRKQCRACPTVPAGCPDQPTPGEAATSVVAQVPTPRGEPPRDRSPPAASPVPNTASVSPTVKPDPKPDKQVEPTSGLVTNTAFRQQLRTSWKAVLRDQPTLDRLQNYCVLCGQWVVMKGPGIKQHIRLMHREVHDTLVAEAASRCSVLGLQAVSPCRYCQLPCKAPRTHVPRCPVVFQASLAGLVVAKEDHTPRPQQRGRNSRWCWAQEAYRRWRWTASHQPRRGRGNRPRSRGSRRTPGRIATASGAEWKPARDPHAMAGRVGETSGNGRRKPRTRRRRCSTRRLRKSSSRWCSYPCGTKPNWAAFGRIAGSCCSWTPPRPIRQRASCQG